MTVTGPVMTLQVRERDEVLEPYKLVAADGARHAATYGPEIFGGYGICDEYPVSMFARDAYQIQFSPISNEMSRNMLMQFQGLPKSWA